MHALAIILKVLDSQPEDAHRRAAITFLVALAMKPGPAQSAASID
jgi:hypothetical protein